jgi:hypothetical protein
VLLFAIAMKNYKTKIGYVFCSIFFLVNLTLIAQTDSTDAALEDYSMYGDETKVKRFATQKVLNLSATKLISIGYEFHGAHTMDVAMGNGSFDEYYKVRSVSQPRIFANFPIISNDRIILNLGAQYWGSAYSVQTDKNTTSLNIPAKYLDEHMLHSVGVIASMFKPLNERNYLILQANLDFNSAFPGNGVSPNGDAFTLSGAAIYGWKPNERKMWGIGVSRTYRMGRPIIVPVLMWNQTFNNKWGTEIILPAKAFIRRNFSAKSLLLAGYELEGNQYLLPGANTGQQGGDIFLQRGEIKPRIQWERQVNNFIWLSAQAGARINGRFNFTNVYNGKEENEIFRTNLGTPFYFNLSLNLISP